MHVVFQPCTPVVGKLHMTGPNDPGMEVANTRDIACFAQLALSHENYCHTIMS